MDRDETAVALGDWIENLWETEQAINYLRHRGLSDDTIEAFRLGFVDRGYYANSIVIPYYDAFGSLRCVRFRRLEGTPKYTQERGAKAHLFNVEAVIHERVYLAEGEFDTMILEQLGYHAIGIQGVQTFKEDWKWLFAGNSVRLCLDSDDAGQDAAEKLMKLLDPFVEDIENVVLPDGEDVSSLYIKDQANLVAELEAYSD